MDNWQKFRLMLMMSGVLVTGLLAWLVDYYHDSAVAYREQRDTARQELTIAASTITDMQVRQRDVAALDAKYTKELTDAQSVISQLERDVAAGKRRLYLNATCRAADTAEPSGVDDAPAATLTPDAERDYWRLRAGIETVTKQVEGLQEYIREQCLR